MDKITISKTKYEQLKKQAAAYKKFAAKFYEFVVKDTIGEIVEDFNKTNLYTNEFLYDLENGLRKSSYTEHYANKAPAARSKKIYHHA